MKAAFCILTTAAILLALPFSASATVTIAGSDETADTTITQMPGSPTDYFLISQSYVLNDFTGAISSVLTPPQGANSTYGFYGTILNPAGGTSYSSIVFDHGYPPAETNLLTFTLGDSPTFNYSDFNVYVLYDNTTGDPNSIDTSITLAAGLTTIDQGYTLAVTDPALKPANAGRIAMFNVTGLSAGDTFTLGAVGAYTDNITPYIGGVSFESLPEPSTYAMMLGGLGLLGFCIRRKLA
jgi:hypothetical protein